MVHSSGRVDESFARKYPNANLKAGDALGLPYNLPFQLNLFFIHLSDLFDEVFAAKYGWERETVAPEKVIEVMDYRVAAEWIDNPGGKLIFPHSPNDPATHRIDPVSSAQVY